MQPYAEVIHSWTTGWWLWHRKIEVHARQMAVPEEQDVYFSIAWAHATIVIDGKIVHTATIPWALPRGERMLATQLYMLAYEQIYRATPWRPILVRSAYMCEAFAPPPIMMWTRATDQCLA